MKQAWILPLLLFAGCAPRPALGQAGEDPYRCEAFAEDAAGRFWIRWQMANGARLTPYSVTWWGDTQANDMVFDLEWETADPAAGPPPDARGVVLLDRARISGVRHRLTLWQGDPPAPGTPALADGRMSDISVFPRVEQPWRVLERLIADGKPLTVTVFDEQGRQVRTIMFPLGQIEAPLARLGALAGEARMITADYRGRCDDQPEEILAN